MKLLHLICFLISAPAVAQNSNRFLNLTARQLAENRSVASRYYFGGTRENRRLDTLSASAGNYRYRALTYVWLRDYEQAAVWLEKTASQFPREHGFVGEIYLEQLHDYPRALRHFDAYDALTPTFNDMISNSPVSYYRGLTYRNLGDHTKAIEQFSIGIDSLIHKHGAEWVNYRHFISRAVSYIAIGQPEKALEDLDKAVRNFNRSALAQYHRGRALLQLNKTAEAQSAFQDAAFFFKALRAERGIDSQEDDFNFVYESDIDQALANLKTLTR